MKQILTILTAVFMTATVWGQSPEKMTYQSVVRNTNDQLVTNTSIGIQISILQTSVSGASVYTERHFPATNINGLVSLEIGTGVIISGDFTAIDWANDAYFLKTEIDLNGGATYTITGTSQLLSVPFSLYANTAGTADYNNLTNLPALNITNWDNAHSWGDHSVEGYLKTVDISDNTNLIAESGIALTDDTISSTLGTTIESNEITNGTIVADDLADTYLTSEVDGSTTNELQHLSLSNNILSLSDVGTTVNLSAYLDDTNTTYTAGMGISLSGTTFSVPLGLTIDSSEITDGTITAADIGPQAVGTSEILDYSITATDIATNAVGEDEIATSAVGSAEVIDNSLTSSDLATNSVGGVELAPSAVYSTHVMDNSLTSDDLATNSVTAAEIADGSILANDLGVINVSTFTNDVGYLTSFTEVDGNITNELQDLSLSNNVLSLSDDATTVDLSIYLDDTNTTYTAGTGLSLSGTVFSLDSNIADNEYINDNSGEIDSSDDFNFTSSTYITNLNADYLDGNDSSYYLDWNNFINIPGEISDGDSDTLNQLACAEGQIAKFIGGVWTCATDENSSSGTITSVSGIAPIVSSGGSTPAISMAQANPSTDGFLDSVDWITFNNKQNRVSGSCSIGSTIRAINADGSVVCEVDSDTNTTYTAGIGLTLTGTVFSNDLGTSIESSEISNGTITGIDIADGAITAADLATNSVFASEIATSAVGSSEIATNAVGSSEVLDNSLTASDLAANAVGASEIATNAVGSAEVMDNSLTANDLAANSVFASEIGTNAVGTSEILDGSITGADIATTANITVTEMTVSNLLVAPKLATAPAGPTAGQIYYDTGVNKLKCYNGTSWFDLF